MIFTGEALWRVLLLCGVGKRLQGRAFKAMSLNCILPKWDEWCFLIRPLTVLCVVKKKQRWWPMVKMLNDMLLARLSQTLAISKCILDSVWHMLKIMSE